MQVIVERKQEAPCLLVDPPPLQNGDRLASHEFLRRYAAMPEVKKAELINGVVYMGSPVTVDHSGPDGLVQMWLGFYAAHTPGVSWYPNTTVILGPKNTPQPDACLCLKPGQGGQTRINDKKYLVGAPELVAEIAASSASLDLGDKLESYAMSGVCEYLVWRTLEQRFDWFILEDGDYLSVNPDRRGLIRSRVFPGLVLELEALLAMNRPRMLAILQRGLASAPHRAFAARLARSR